MQSGHDNNKYLNSVFPISVFEEQDKSIDDSSSYQQIHN